MKKAFISIDAIDGKRLEKPEFITWHLMDDNATAADLADDFMYFIEHYATLSDFKNGSHMHDCTVYVGDECETLSAEW